MATEGWRGCERGNPMEIIKWLVLNTARDLTEPSWRVGRKPYAKFRMIT
jgi:hypothetical protein